MIAALVVLSLLSLLVATDPEPGVTSVCPTPEPPLRPSGEPDADRESEAKRLAA